MKNITIMAEAISKPGSSDFGFVFECAWEVVNKGIYLQRMSFAIFFFCKLYFC